MAAALVAGALLGCDTEPRFTDADREAGAAFYRAVDASNAATTLINRYTTTHRSPDPDALAAIRVHVRLARDAAAAVPDDLLERMHPDLRTLFRDEFEPALAVIDAALGARDAGLMADGYRRLERWLDWLERHAREIRYPPK